MYSVTYIFYYILPKYVYNGEVLQRVFTNAKLSVTKNVNEIL